MRNTAYPQKCTDMFFSLPVFVVLLMHYFIFEFALKKIVSANEMFLQKTLVLKQAQNETLNKLGQKETPNSSGQKAYILLISIYDGLCLILSRRHVLFG